ncbi:MAG: acyl carrier protein [Magnetococcales bacterium]|nr:acyl carrier protein [Magnetococcales bacterium]
MTPTDITPEALRQALAQGSARPADMIDLESSFAANDFDSIELLAMRLELEDVFGLSIPPTAFDTLVQDMNRQGSALNALLPYLASLRNAG